MKTLIQSFTYTIIIAILACIFQIHQDLESHTEEEAIILLDENTLASTDNEYHEDETYEFEFD